MAASNGRWARVVYTILGFSFLSVTAFLNLEELNEMKYGIEILSDPVIKGQVRLPLLFFCVVLWTHNYLREQIVALLSVCHGVHLYFNKEAVVCFKIK